LKRFHGHCDPALLRGYLFGAISAPFSTPRRNASVKMLSSDFRIAKAPIKKAIAESESM
jgi:hypothetical protein